MAEPVPHSHQSGEPDAHDAATFPGKGAASVEQARAHRSESRYPAHEKLQAVSDESQALGEFLDLGLSRLGLALYETRDVSCECWACRRGEATWARGLMAHTDEELESREDGEGPVRYKQEVPVVRSIQAILAAYFGIDQRKLDAEKQAMLEAMRSA